MNKLENNHYSLCLNMIVKNESHIIRNTLEKLLKKIKFDYWVISDTGSTDNTKEIILDFFKEVNICGEIFDDEWKGFGHNRTKALEHAYKKSKYLLVFDADDELCGDFVLPELVLDSYHFQFGDAIGISYTRTQLINNQKKWKYFGVLHEFIGCMEPTNGTDVIRGNYYTLSGKSGNRSKDANKYLNDAKILEEAYDEAVNNNDAIYNRYGFYCANSYYDCGKYEDAIKWYKKTLESGCWCQEKYVSCLRIYNCYKCLKQQETGFFYLVKSAEYDKERVECFYELIQHYCCSGLNENAYAYYTVIKPFYDKYLTAGLENKLFIDCSKANFFLPYYMIIVAHHVKDYDTGVYMFRTIFTKKHKEFNKFFVGNMLFNLQFFTEQIKSEDLDEFKTLFKGYADFLLANNYPLYDHDFMNNYEKFGIIVPKFEPEFSRGECSTSKKILIYTGYAPFEWNYSFSLENALGGSETSASCLSKSFPKEYEIYVSGSVKEEKVDNVTYVNLHNLKDLIKTTAFHTIIVSRYLHFYEVYKNFSAYQTFIWGHDIELYSYGADISVDNILSKWSSKITGCICQTEWHKKRFLSLYPELTDKMNVINNGIQVELFTSNNKKESNKFIYTSCSERGLSKLIQLWPSILENLPDAELTISSYNKFPNTEEDYKNLEYINQTPSIKHVGKLNRPELYNLMSNAEYWLYPSYFPETSCITSLEMLASQVICLYYPVAGLVNTVGDYGIPIAEGNEIDTLLNLSMKRKCELKIRGKEYALSCSWQNRASEWCNIIFSKELQLHNNIKQLSAVEKRMFYLYETISMPDAHVKLLSRLSKDFTPNVIYDIGAHALHWTKEASKIWKNTEIIAFDAIKEAEELYKSQNIKYNIGVLSDSDDKIVKFYENKENPAGNSYYKEIGHRNSATIFPEDSYTEQVSMTLGTIVKKNNYILPDLVKIDVQGAELDILKGGINVINHAKYLIIELQHLEYNRGAPLSRVTIDFLNNNGWEIVEEKFSNNGPDADYLFINNNMKRNRELAIFNSFPFHYEMFGYILNYAKKNNYHVDIYTNFSNNLGWFDFYNGLFKGIISFIDYNEFDCEKSNNNYYEFIFITTDDDPLFKKEWIKDNVISINHYYQIRNPNYKHYLNVANFKDSILEYVYACYPLVDFTEKNKNKNKNNIITIIGNGKVAEWDYNTINRICSKNEINLNLITRDPELFDASQINSKIKINIFGNMNAADMIDILKNTSYILSNYNKNYYHNTGLGSSGSSAIALSSLCKLIIGKSSNSFFKLKNVLEFDIDSDEPINIDGDINFKEIQDERTSYVEKFERYIDNIKSNTYIKKYFEFDDVYVNLLKDTKNLKYIYQNYSDRAAVEPMFRKLVNYLFPHFVNKNIIDLGAYIGDNTIPWALKSSGIIYAIDPSAENINFIEKMARINNINNIITFEKTISDVIETVYCHELDTTHISCNTIGGIHSFKPITIDNLKLEDIGFIHLDVEGFEQKVLNGSIKTIKTYNPIITWENHINHDDFNYTNQFLKKLGYKSFMINEKLPGCFDDCRNFISFPKTVKIDINNINSMFGEIYKNYTLMKHLPFLIDFDIKISSEMPDISLQNEQKIPKKIFQTWETNDIEPEFQKIVNKWKEYNPEYEYVLYNNLEREVFIKENFGETAFNAYNKIIPGAYKCDFWRYCILYIYGGVYIDIDSLCMGKLDNFITNSIEFVVPIDLNSSPYEGTHNLACGFISSIPKHPILLKCIERIIYNVENNIIPNSKLDFSGPGLLGRETNKYLNLPETNSFIGKEGIDNDNNIHFLKFEGGCEYVKNLNGDILFQNKNGNFDIIRLYEAECRKLKDYVSWCSCSSSQVIEIEIETKNIALLVYGQFRTYKNNLRNNMCMLEPIFKKHKIHVFILSDKLEKGNYSIENEEEIMNILKEFNCNIHFMDYIENYKNSEENEVVNNFLNGVKITGKTCDDFVPNLMYRKYLLNKLKNEYTSSHNIKIDLNIYCRIFDTIIRYNLPVNEIEKMIDILYNEPTILLGSSDTFFIGRQNTIDHLFSIVNLYKEGKIYGDEIWEDINCLRFLYDSDSCLCNVRAIYSPEIQYLAHMYYSPYTYINMRVDFNNVSSPLNIECLYHVILDPNRTTNNKTNVKIRIDFKKSTIIETTQRFLHDNQNIALYSDVREPPGKEHYYFLASLSLQVHNLKIIELGTHHGRSAYTLAYGNRLLNNNNKIVTYDINECIIAGIFDNTNIEYKIENLFDPETREKRRDEILSSNIIFIDIDPHEGVFEYEMYLWLKKNDYKGILLFDDIHLGVGHMGVTSENSMQKFWEKIEDVYKIDLTHVGHWSGTGLVCFHFETHEIIVDEQ